MKNIPHRTFMSFGLALSLTFTPLASAKPHLLPINKHDAPDFFENEAIRRTRTLNAIEILSHRDVVPIQPALHDDRILYYGAVTFLVGSAVFVTGSIGRYFTLVENGETMGMVRALIHRGSRWLMVSGSIVGGVGLVASATESALGWYDETYRGFPVGKSDTPQGKIMYASDGPSRVLEMAKNESGQALLEAYAMGDRDFYNFLLALGAP